MPFSLPTLTVPDLAFVVLVLVLMHLAKRWVLLYALLVWPGTVLHELAHWLVALLSGGRPTSLSIVPSRSERGWRLGAVGIGRVRWFNALPIGAAPLLLAPLAWFALTQVARVDANHWLHWLALYLAVGAAVSCLPSLADWKIVVSRPLGLLLYLAVAAAAGYLWVQR